MTPHQRLRGARWDSGVVLGVKVPPSLDALDHMREVHVVTSLGSRRSPSDRGKAGNRDEEGGVKSHWPTALWLGPEHGGDQRRTSDARRRDLLDVRKFVSILSRFWLFLGRPLENGLSRGSIPSYTRYHQYLNITALLGPPMACTAPSETRRFQMSERTCHIMSVA